MNPALVPSWPIILKWALAASRREMIRNAAGW
jgi:hypothetical protein